MTDLLKMLHEERATLARKLAGIDAAISALKENAVPKSATKSAPAKRAPVKRKWKISAEGRARISAAAKKRWAKIKR
jgi:hypothetical protein